VFIPKKGTTKTPAKKPLIKFKDPHPRLNYNKKNKNNKNNGTLFTRFIASIGGFEYIILNRFI
jgi:hypothetical protein